MELLYSYGGARSCTASLLKHARIFPTPRTELTDHDRAGGTFSRTRPTHTQEPAPLQDGDQE